jgi:hypothetical protein
MRCSNRCGQVLVCLLAVRGLLSLLLLCRLTAAAGGGWGGGGAAEAAVGAVSMGRLPSCTGTQQGGTPLCCANRSVTDNCVALCGQQKRPPARWQVALLLSVTQRISYECSSSD